jgi:aminopeptidase N
LYNLWVNFPTERSKYLSKTKDFKGFSDLNIRLLWLVFHLNTPEYQADKKAEVYAELLSYTGSKYAASVRLNAFQYLDLLKACNEQCQINLEKAKSHHNWQLVKFAKQMSNTTKEKN